jgi:hypothetical protein
MTFFILNKTRIALVVAVVVAVVALLNAFTIVHWDNGRSIVVSGFASAVLVLLMSIQQHFMPGTAEEPVAIAQSINAVVISAVALIVTFQIFIWSPQQQGVIFTLTAVVLALFGGWGARAAVTAKITPPKS